MKFCVAASKMAKGTSRRLLDGLKTIAAFNFSDPILEYDKN
jgi:hypothetical protein